MGIFNKIVEKFVDKPEIVNISKMDRKEFFQNIYEYGISLGLYADECIRDTGFSTGEIDYLRNGLAFSTSKGGSNIFVILQTATTKHEIILLCVYSNNRKEVYDYTEKDLEICKDNLLKSLENYKTRQLNMKMEKINEDF